MPINAVAKQSGNRDPEHVLRAPDHNADLVRLIVNAITAGVLGPFFFVSIGLRVDLGALTAVPLVVGALVALAFAGKVIGAAVPARLIGFSRESALAVGTGMTSRGVVALVVLGVAYEAGVFTTAGTSANEIVRHLFSALVIMALANTFLMPVALRFILRRHGGRAAAPSSERPPDVGDTSG